MDEKNGKFEIENVNIELKVINTSITHFLAKEVVRKLGMCTCPKLQWDEQLKVMKEEMIESIAKLNNT